MRLKKKAITALNEINSNIMGIVQLVASEGGQNSILVGGSLPVVVYQIKKAIEENQFIKEAFKMALELSDNKEEEEEEEDDSNDIFETMSRSELKSFIKKYSLNIKVYKSMSDDDIRQAIRNRLENID